MWLSEKGKTTGEVIFDLGSKYKLELIKVWNYNERQQTKRGVKKADISIWTQDEGWKKLFSDFAFEEAPGSDDYDDPVLVKLDRVEAQKVRFDNMENFGDPEYIGLAKVQLFRLRGPQATNPLPADKTSSDCNVTLAWSPGLDAVSHSLYFGYKPDKLKLLGELKGADNCTAKLTPLARRAECYWRVDEVQSNGSVVKGAVWNFSTGKTVGWWKFDEPQGSVAKDSAGSNDGILKGSLKWKPAEGKFGGSIAFDGNDGFVELPKDVGKIGGAFSITLWAYPTEPQYWARFIELGNDPYYDDIFLARVDTSENLSLMVWSGEGKDQVRTGRLDAANAIELNKWQFFAAIVDNQGNAKLYKDGNPIQTGDVVVPRYVQKQKNYIGKSIWPNDLNFKGMMDDVRLYSYALGESEIKDIYNGKDRATVTAAKLPSIIGEAGKAEAEGVKGRNLVAVLVIFIVAVAIIALTGRKKHAG